MSSPEDESAQASEHGPEGELVVGVFKFINEVELAVDELKSLGYGADVVTIIANENVLKEHFPEQREAAQPDDWKRAAAASGSAGAVLGGLFTATALATGAAIPVVIAGGMAGMLTGGVVGGLTGAMAERGFESEATDYFEVAVADGRVLVAVDLHADAHEDMAAAKQQVRDVLAKAGGEPVTLDSS